MAEIFYQGMLWITAALVLLSLLSFLEARNPPRLRIDLPPRLPSNPPLVSVVVPARNEERNIPGCLESLLAQDYPNYEVIVVDDRSTDRTGALVEEVARKDARVRLLKGVRLQEGWLGKSHAVHQGVREASGEWFLFVDADTWHHPRSLSAAMSHVLNEKVDMLSLYPHFLCKTFWEKVIQPAVGRMILIAGPVKFVNSRRPALRIFFMAIGQFILIRRRVYEAVGGHEAIRGRVTEDVELARGVKRAGYCLNFLYGTDALHTRMYDNFTDLWRGWSRSFYPAMGNNTPLAVVENLLLFVFGTVPYLNLPVTALLLLLGVSGPVLWPLFGLGLFHYALLMLATYTVRRRLGEYPEYFYTCPVGGLMVQWIALHSLYSYALKKQVLWKNRDLNAG